MRTITDALEMHEVVDLLRQSVAEVGTVRGWAGAKGMSGEYVGSVLMGRTNPGPKILEALGIEAFTLYRRVGDAAPDRSHS